MFKIWSRELFIDDKGKPASQEGWLRTDYGLSQCQNGSDIIGQYPDGTSTGVSIYEAATIKQAITALEDAQADGIEIEEIRIVKV